MKKQFVIAVVLIVIIAAALFWMVSNDQKPTAYLLKGENMQIQGSYGVTVPLNEISGLELISEMPAIGRKTNGMGLGSHYKGEFTFQDGTKARLYVDASKPPFISFLRDDTVYTINAQTPEKTQELYEQLKAAVERLQP